MLFLIGAVNLAGLLRARGAYRRGEFALRTSLGASRGRLARQVSCETVPLAIGGAAAWHCRRARHARRPWCRSCRRRCRASRRSACTRSVLMAAVLLAIATAFTRCDRVGRQCQRLDRPRAVHLGASRRSADRRHRSPARSFCSSAPACCSAASATVRTVDPGLQPAPVLSLHLAISRSKHGDDAGVAASLSRCSSACAACPASRPPASSIGCRWAASRRSARCSFEGDDRLIDTDWRSASGNYFDALGVPLVAGRAIRRTRHARIGRPSASSTSGSRATCSAT